MKCNENGRAFRFPKHNTRFRDAWCLTVPFASTRPFARATTLAFFAKAIIMLVISRVASRSLLSEPPVAEVLREVAEGSVDGGVPGAREGLLGARAEHGLVRGERRLDRGGRRERVRERARGAPEGTLRRWADGACFVSGARGSGRESGAAVTSRARRARARRTRLRRRRSAARRENLARRSIAPRFRR